MRARLTFLLVGAGLVAAASCVPDYSFQAQDDAGPGDAGVDHTQPPPPPPGDSGPRDAADATTDGDAGVDAPPPPPPDADAGPPPITALVARRTDACLIRDGKIYCWGTLNNAGELGTTPSDAAIPSPRPIDMPATPVFTRADEIELANPVGYDRLFACARSNGAVWCWGDDEGSQLGPNGGDSGPALVPIPFLQGGTVGVGLGSVHACGIVDPADATAQSNTYCWGSSVVSATGPRGAGGGGTQVVGVPAFKAIYGGGAYTCGITWDHPTITCWGASDYFRAGQEVDAAPEAGMCDPNDTNIGDCTPRTIPLPGGAVPKTLSLGQGFGCALTETGDVYCWGADDDYDLGGPLPFDAGCPYMYSSSCTPIPQKVALDRPAVAMSAGSAHGCAVLSGDGAVECWGLNYGGQLGADLQVGTSTPVYVVDPANIRNHLVGIDLIASGDQMTCAVSGQKIYCWGTPIPTVDGGTTTVPVAIPTPW